MDVTERNTKKRFLVSAEAFEKWMLDVLHARGFSSEEASHAARWAVQTATYEVETHGARKLLHLLDDEFARSGSCQPKAQHQVLLQLGALDVWDGKRKLGPAIARMAQSRSVDIAKSQGLGVVFVRNCNHFGWGPAYPLELLDEGLLVGNACQGAIPIVTPISGKEACIGSNAISIVLETGVRESPQFIWDTGTAAMSWGEVQKLRLEAGGRLREGCAVDVEGSPTLNPDEAACLLPGGSIGNALGILIELLSANVGAGNPRFRSMPEQKSASEEVSTCVFVFFAVNLAAFDALSFPKDRSRMENVAAMVDAILTENGAARMVGMRKYLAKLRSEKYGGLLFSGESIEAFREEAQTRNICFPKDVQELDVFIESLVVAGK